MTQIRNLFVGLSLALVSFAGSASAQNSHSWVSSTGSGTACTRALPCHNVIDALAATLAGGVISMLDSADYSNFSITKSVTIRAEGVDGGNSLSQGVEFFINVIAGPTDVITLEGLKMNAGAISFVTGGHLHVVRCFIANHNNAGTDGYGIRFSPNAPSKLSVTDTVISNNGSGTGGGIVIYPTLGGSARVNLERVTVNGNAFGIAADGSNSTAGINLTIADSMIGGNTQDGILATTPAGGAPIGVMVTNSKSVNNAFGIRAIGSGVTVRTNNSDIIGNVTGLSFSGGGSLLTFGNNRVRANATDGTFSGPVALQ